MKNIEKTLDNRLFLWVVILTFDIFHDKLDLMR